MSTVSRRDFLKLLAGTSAGLGLLGVNSLRKSALAQTGDKPNIIVLVFDAMSAQNLSLYGYPRPTTPNLDRFAQRATVYHRHYAGGNFTIPGTASMLTGLYPWHHRAFAQGSLVRRGLADNLFHAAPGHHQVGFSQNIWADLLLRQFHTDVQDHLPSPRFSDKNLTVTASHRLPNDPVVAYYALDEFLLSSHQVVNPYPGSALLGYLDISYNLLDHSTRVRDESYPFGVPNNSYYTYRHPQVFEGLRGLMADLNRRNSPWLGYFHLYSPHTPYRPRAEFAWIFPELKLPFKKRHPLAANHADAQTILSLRDRYDEFIADLDHEFGILIDALEREGVLDTSYLFVTSDHGEVFERGEWGHGSPLLYEPVIRIPLLVSAPGQRERKDVHVPTSNTDLVPTIAHLSGGSTSPGLDGRRLPELGGAADPARGIFSMVAKDNSSFLPIQEGTVALVRGRWKLIYYQGYTKAPTDFEMYDLVDDPFELKDIAPRQPSELAAMREELLDSLSDADRPYQR